MGVSRAASSKVPGLSKMSGSIAVGRLPVWRSAAHHSIDAHARAPLSQRGAAAAHLSLVFQGRQFGRLRCLGCQKCQGQSPTSAIADLSPIATIGCASRSIDAHARAPLATRRSGLRDGAHLSLVVQGRQFGRPRCQFTPGAVGQARQLSCARPSTVAHRRLGRAQARFRWVQGGRGEFCRSESQGRP